MPARGGGHVKVPTVERIEQGEKRNRVMGIRMKATRISRVSNNPDAVPPMADTQGLVSIRGQYVCNCVIQLLNMSVALASVCDRLGDGVEHAG